MALLLFQTVWPGRGDECHRQVEDLPPFLGSPASSGTDVGIMVKDNNSGDFNTLITELQSDGTQTLESNITYGIIEGMLPIAQLPTIAQLSQTLSVVPMFKPIVEFAP
jgi:hypothetical protein